MNAIVYEQIVSLSGLIALWAFWYYLWKPQRVDIVRQKLFALRSDLFDLAADGALPFDHPAYTQLRLLINGLIRFAHRATFLNLILAAKQSEKIPSDVLIAWQKSVQKLPEESRNQLMAVHEKVSDAFVGHAVGGSIILSTFVGFRVALSVVRALFQLLTGRRSLGHFTVDRARLKVGKEGSEITKTGSQVIEARVLYEEQRRTNVKTRHAYAQ